MSVRLSTRLTSRWPRRPELLQMQPPFVVRHKLHRCHTPAPQTPTQPPALSTTFSAKLPTGLFAHKASKSSSTPSSCNTADMAKPLAPRGSDRPQVVPSRSRG